MLICSAAAFVGPAPGFQTSFAATSARLSVSSLAKSRSLGASRARTPQRVWPGVGLRMSDDDEEELNALVEKFHRQLANASATKSSVSTAAATTAPPAELNSSPSSFSTSSASSRASAKQAENRPILSGLTGATGSRAAKELQEQIADKAQDVSALEQGDKKKYDIGVSQFQQVPNSTWTGTTTLEKADGQPETGVWGQRWDASLAAKVKDRQLSWPELVLDRLLDGVEDGLAKAAEKPAEARQGTGYFELQKGLQGGEKRERIVIIGSGWGSHAFVKGLDATKYDVTLISPRNYFLFTPMLAGAAVGTVEMRSITESIREANPDVNYLEATVTEVSPADKKLSAQSVVCEGAECSITDFDVEYDTLVYGVGASVNTFGISGVKDHCYFLKQVGDAARLREAIGNTFERANLPDMSEEERIRTLTFVVVGAGPTGVELTAELKDFIEDDCPRYYRHLLPYIRIKVLEASDRVLMQMAEGLQSTAVSDLEKPPPQAVLDLGLPADYVKVLLKSSVKDVSSTAMTLNDGTVIPYGIAVWAAGIGPLPLTLDLIDKVEEQKMDEKARGRLVCDKWMRVHGCPGVLALGDCSYIDGSPLPATAQVAAQQGAYLARLFNRDYDLTTVVPVKKAKASPEALAALRFGDSSVAKTFQFLNLGILAYTGNQKALAQLEAGSLKLQIAGLLGWLGWRSVYLAKQVSNRNQAMVAFDWAKTSLFGRDLSRF